MTDFDKLYQQLMESVMCVEKFDHEMGSSRKIDADKLIDYINRIIVRRETPKKQKKNLKKAMKNLKEMII